MKLREQIKSCAGCSACCLEQGSPPGYLLLLQMPPAERAAWPDQADVERVAHLPDEALARLADYHAKLMGAIVSGDGPCCWLDDQADRCAFYDHRPQICRDLAVGSAGCRSWRKLYSID